MDNVTHARSLLTSLALVLVGLLTTHASDITEVLPLTNQILVVHFDDGSVEYHKSGEPYNADQVFVDPLNVGQADQLNTYTISSSDDPAYASALAPQQLWRKSKGTEFAVAYDGSVPHAKEHWVYLTLPSPLQRGKTYTITTGNLAKNKNIWQLTYDEKQLRSEAIHVNTVAYEAEAEAKYGYLYHWAGTGGAVNLSMYDGAPFSLVNTQSNQSVFTGQVTFRKGKNNVETFVNTSRNTPNQNFLGADVYECDFSSFSTPGEYTLVIDGIGRSFPFEVKQEAFFQPYFLAMKGLYQNRSGIELKAPFTDFPRPAPHHPQLTPGFKGRLKYTKTRVLDLQSAEGLPEDFPQDKAAVEAGKQGSLENTWGWYQDAGDWDGYYRHTEIPAQLMFLFESGGNFTDGELNIPESGNGLPDVLDEAAWLLRFYHRARKEITDRGWGTGGVPGARVFPDLSGLGDTGLEGVQRGSWEDTDRDWYVTGEDPWMSYKYAGLAAQFAFILQQIGQADPQGINWESEARSAYEWAEANTQSGDDDVFVDERKLLPIVRLYAAASLYRLTGQDTYHQTFLQESNLLVEPKILANGDTNPPFQERFKEETLAAFTYLSTDPSLTDPNRANQIRSAFTTANDKILLDAPARRACRWGGDLALPMLIGQPTTPLVTNGVFGHVDQQRQNPGKAQQYLKNLYTTGDYFMGANPLNITWITGAGDRPPQQIFHLDWWDSEREDVLPGVVPYGPWRADGIVVNPFSPGYAWETTTPANIETWPGHERWFNQRSAVLHSEFTIDQNTLAAAVVYGFLAKRGKGTIMPPPPPSEEEGTGLAYQLYNTPSLEEEVRSGVHPTIDFDWERSGPEGVGNNLFSFRWTGEIKAPTSGFYTFYARTDDGVRLTVNGQLLIDFFKDRPARESVGTINLEAGKKYTIRMEYYENYGRAVAELRWSGPEVDKQIIPQKYLYPAAPQNSASRTANQSETSPVLVPSPLRVFPNPAVDQQVGIAGAGVAGAHISIQTLEGKTIQHRIVSSGPGRAVVVPTLRQPPGLYLITVARPGEDVHVFKCVLK